MAQKELIIEIRAETKKAVQEIEALKKEIKTFGERVKSNNKSLKANGAALESLAGKVKGLVAAYAGFSAIRSVVGVIGDFEQAVAKLGAISGASKENLDALRQKAEELGKSTIFSASQVADGMTYLAMAGYKTEEIMASIGDVLNLAAVGQIELAQASDIASNILSGFGLKAEETARVVDVMTATITNANTDIPEMGEAMKYVAPQAKALGVSLEETAAAIGILSNAGIKGTMAGTGLSAMLVRLAAPTGRAREAMDALGIKVYDASGKFVGFQNVLKQFKTKMAGMSQEMKAMYIKDIFGLETMKTALTLIDSVGGGYDKLYKTVADATGMTERKVKQMTDTFQGHMKALQSAMEGLAIVVGNELLPALTKMVEWLTTAAQEAGEFYEENKELVNTLVKLTATLWGLNKLKSIVSAVMGASAAKSVATMLGGVKSLKSAVTGLGAALMGLGRANAVILALTATISALDYAFDKYHERIDRLDDATKMLNESTQESAKLFDEVERHMRLEEGRKEIVATAKELEAMKKRTLELIAANEKRLIAMKRLYREGSSDNEALKRQIDQLANKNRLLKGLYKKLSAAKPHEGAKRSAKEAKRAVEGLSEAERKYRLELARMSEKEIVALRRTYDRRVSAHRRTVERLLDKERSLNARIVQLKRQLVEKLASLERRRAAAIEAIEDRIHNLRMAGASEYERFIDRQKQAEMKLAKAKAAIERGKLEEAKRYMGQYRALIDRIADTEIKEGKRVIVSKQQANRIAIAGLKKLEGVTDAYYAKAKAQARAAHNQKMAQLRAQLQATRAQLQLEMQRLKLERQLVQALTGKKVDIDISGAQAAIKRLDAQIAALKPKVRLDADTAKAKAKVEREAKAFERKKITAKVDADTREAKREVGGILTIVDKATGKKRVIKIYADAKEAKRKIGDVDKEAKRTKPIVRVKSDVSQALANIRKIPKSITTIHYIKTVETHATGGLAGFQRAGGKIPGDDPLNSDDVPALLTRGEFVVRRDAVRHYGEDFLYRLNRKLLPRFATGGIVEVSKPMTRRFYDKNLERGGENKEKQPLVYQASIQPLEINIDLSGIEEATANLSQSVEKVPKNAGGKIATLVHDAQKMLDGLKNLLKTAGNMEKRIERDNRRVESFVRDSDGKEVNINRYRKFKEKERKLESVLKKDERAVSDLENKIATMQSVAMQKAQSVDDYTLHVEALRSEIESTASEKNLRLPQSVDGAIRASFDADRLEAYLAKLENFKPLDESAVKSRFDNIMKRWINWAYKYSMKTGLDYVDLLKHMPPRLMPFLSSLGIKDKDAARRLRGMIVKSSYNINSVMPKIVEYYDKSNVPRFQAGGLFRFEKGGKLPGYGGGDRRLALLEDGEFVIRKEAVARFGPHLFEKLNRIELPKFKTGGMVGPAFGKSETGGMVNIEFRMPSGKSYGLMGGEEIARALAGEFKRMM